jgi:hypothetical protein
MLKIFTHRYLLFFICVATFWQACDIINPHEVTPTYVHIDSFTFIQNPNVFLHDPVTGNTRQGVVVPTTHAIGSVWVYYNENPIGIFDLPVTFPVMASGSQSLQFAPSIAVNGQNNVVNTYSYYTLDTSTLIANPGHIINYSPKTEFYPDVKVTYIANFEEYDPTPFLQWGGGGNRQMIRITGGDSVVCSGSGAGEVTLLAIGDSSVDSTKNAFSIPDGVAFIEFDYKSTIPFYIGLQANLSSKITSTPNYLTGVNPNANGGWQKFYLEVDGFTAKAQTGITGVTYNLYIKAVLGNGQSSGRLLIDNIQLVTF